MLWCFYVDALNAASLDPNNRTIYKNFQDKDNYMAYMYKYLYVQRNFKIKNKQNLRKEKKNLLSWSDLSFTAKFKPHPVYLQGNLMI